MITNLTCIDKNEFKHVITSAYLLIAVSQYSFQHCIISIRYPGEEQLVRKYRQHMAWIIYKREMVNREMKFQKAKGIKRTTNDKTIFSAY